MHKKFIAKHHPAPTADNNTPATAGPKSLAILKQVELSEIALPKSFLSSTRRT